MNLEALSRTEGQNRQAGNRARRGCYSQAGYPIVGQWVWLT